VNNVTLGRKKLLLLAGAAAAAGAVVVLASHSVAARPTTSSVTAICRQSSYSHGQPIVVAKIDATASTRNALLRSQYAQAVDSIATAASSEGAYLVVDTFGANPAQTRRLCAISTRVTGAAPLFVTARNAELRRLLDQIARRASTTNDGAQGSAVFGALVDAAQQVRELRTDPHVPATIVIVTDGDEATRHTHLRLLLDSGASNRTIVARIVGKLSPPLSDAATIEMDGVGRVGNGPPISTTDARRMVQIWQRICRQTRAERCSITNDLPFSQSLGR
jgi:hypothetical protein